MTTVLRVKLLSEDARIPERAHKGDAGLDLYCANAVDLAPGEFKAIGTGIAIELPEGTEGQVRPRSGLAMAQGITVLNSPGTVDSNYRGELIVLLVNHGPKKFHAGPGSRIAQLVIAPIVEVSVEQVEYIEPTARGESGFGSTGA